MLVLYFKEDYNRLQILIGVKFWNQIFIIWLLKSTIYYGTCLSRIHIKIIIYFQKNNNKFKLDYFVLYHSS